MFKKVIKFRLLYTYLKNFMSLLFGYLVRSVLEIKRKVRVKMEKLK